MIFDFKFKSLFVEFCHIKTKNLHIFHEVDSSSRTGCEMECMIFEFKFKFYRFFFTFKQKYILGEIFFALVRNFKTWIPFSNLDNAPQNQTVKFFHHLSHFTVVPNSKSLHSFQFSANKNYRHYSFVNKYYHKEYKRAINGHG